MIEISLRHIDEVYNIFPIIIWQNSMLRNFQIVIRIGFRFVIIVKIYFVNYISVYIRQPVALNDTIWRKTHSRIN